jgi:AraC-like DNA-binding protein
MKHVTRHTDLVMSAANPLVLVVMLNEMGYPESEVLADTGIVHEQLQDFKNHMSFDQYRLLIANALRLTGDPHLGLKFGQRLHVTGYNVLGLGAIASETFMEALRFANRSNAVINPSIQLVISEDKNYINVNIEQTAPWEDAHLFIIDIQLAACHELVSMFDADVARDVMYYVDYPRPDDLGVYEGYISGKLHFEYPYNRISIPEEFCYRPLPMRNPTALKQAEGELQKFLESVNNQHQQLLLSIKELLTSRAGEIPSFEVVAEKFHVSPRTLNRRLGAIGTSYKEIVSEIRKRQATEYLSGTRFSIDEIAYRLGYREPSNFSKAFRRWTGLSPSQYRDKYLSFGSGPDDDHNP